MSEWREYRISDVATLIKDSWKVGDEQLPYLGLEHIDEAKLRLNGIGSSDDVASNKYRFSSGDVLFGKLRPYFRKVVKPSFNGICSTDMWVLNATEKSDIDFIFYFFANQELIDLSYSSSSGTRMPRADWKFLSQTLWDIPQPEEQKAIAEVLSSLDDKIDLLHRQNKTLEELAQTLFRQWFIEEAGDGWEVGTLDEILTVKGGTTPSTKNDEYWNGNICWSTPKDLSLNSDMYLFDTARKITESGLAKIGSGLLPKGTILLSSRAPVGYLAIAEVPLAINQGYIAILDDKGFSKYFIYLWLKSNMEYIISNANGSTFLEISKTVFKSLDIIKPLEELRKKFDEVVIENFEKIKANTKQIKTLENMRDTLLPKFMSGEVRVKLNGE
ncbi:MAG: restriction endonuclease subunit S [Campylobacterota bacterium]|nr:restriction endonuclease subunit S [Campylobacterota bacterium]